MVLTNIMERFHRLVQLVLRLLAAAAAAAATAGWASGQSTHSTAEVVRAAVHLLGTCGSADLTLNLGKVGGKASLVTAEVTTRIRYPFKMMNERQRHCTAVAEMHIHSELIEARDNHKHPGKGLFNRTTIYSQLMAGFPFSAAAAIKAPCWLFCKPFQCPGSTPIPPHSTGAGVRAEHPSKQRNRATRGQLCQSDSEAQRGSQETSRSRRARRHLSVSQ